MGLLLVDGKKLANSWPAHVSPVTIPETTAGRISAPGARFSKVPIINGPVKLSPFTLKIEVSIVLHLAW